MKQEDRPAREGIPALQGREEVKELICPACGETSSRLPADHEMMLTEDAAGWPVLICSYAVPRQQYATEVRGAGGSG